MFFAGYLRLAMRISQHWDLHVLFLERKPISEGLKAGRRIRAQNIQCPEYPLNIAYILPQNLGLVLDLP
jgi:hypothetical protein